MSTNIIDALVITLGLDAANYSSGSKKARKDLKDLRDEGNKTAKDLAKQGKEAAQFFRELRNEAIALFAALTAGKGLERFIEDVTQANFAIGLLSKNLNVATQTITAWSNAAEIAGGTADGMQGTMSMLSMSMTEMQVTGQTAILPYLRALGVNMADAAGRARPLDDVLLDLSDRFSGMDRVTANNFGKMMGIDQGTMNLLLQGRKAVEEQIRKQKELHLVTAQDAEQSRKLREAWITLRQEAESLGRSFVAWVTPGLISVFEWLEKVGRWVGENKTAVLSFLTAFAIVVGTAIAPAIWAALAPLLLIGGVILGIVAALGLLIDDWATWLNGGKSELGSFWQFFADGWNASKATFKKVLADLGAVFSDEVGILKAIWHVFTSLLDGDEFRKAIREAAHALVQYFLDAFNLVKDGWHGLKQFFGFESPGAAPSSSSSSSSGSGPRGIRNNNPGNLNYAGQAGATKESGANGRFAVFGSMEEGVGALGKQLRLYAARGTNTIRKIVGKYAPASENNVGAYISALVSATGIDADTPLNLDDAKTMQALVKGIINHENGAGHVSDAQIAAGLSGGGGALAPNPGALASAAPAGARAAASQAGDSSTRVNAETNIQQITIHTAATDAKGIAAGIGGALKAQGLIYQADQGLT